MVNTSGAQASIGNGQTLNADAAQYWIALVTEIKAETGFDIVPTEGTRTFARQQYLYENRNRPGFNPAWSPYSPYAYHLSGRAVDVGSMVGYVNTASSKAFYARAGKYGFRPTVLGEPWHFEWRQEWTRTNLPGPVPATDEITPIPVEEEEEEDMRNLLITTEAKIVGKGVTDTWMANPMDRTYMSMANATQISAMQQAGAVTIQGTQPHSILNGFTPVDPKKVLR